jgi:hypothetical protein
MRVGETPTAMKGQRDQALSSASGASGVIGRQQVRPIQGLLSSEASS